MSLIIFDLDGVLIDSEEFHKKCLNEALENIDKKFKINDYEDELFKSKTLREKLKLLTIHKNLDASFYDYIIKQKQLLTIQHIKTHIHEDYKLINIMKKLKYNHNIVCASNSMYETVKMSLLKLGIMEYIDFFISHEEVDNPKPEPDMFLKCINRFKTKPENTLVIDDSDIGIQAAKKCGANFIKVKSRKDLDIIFVASSRYKVNSVFQII